LRADAFLLKIVADGNRCFRRVFTHADVASPGDGRSRLSGQIGESQEAFALTIARLRQRPRFFQNSHGGQFGDRFAKALVQALFAEMPVDMHQLVDVRREHSPYSDGLSIGCLECKGGVE